jgi:oligopeptide/dipeptide ABC transporter ATP-binding protein
MLLAVQDLVKHYRAGGFLKPAAPPVRAVDGVSFTLARGETLGLVGESGCGKTTVGRTIIRLQEPTAGRALLDGTDVFTLGAEALRAMRRRVQMVFQDPYGSLNPRMRVGDAIAEGMEIHNLGTPPERRARVEQLLEEVGLDADYARRYPHEFSGGQRQRIGIARALAVEPELIICDEPVSALDVSVQAQVLNLLADLQRTHGLAFLFIAHDLAVVRQIAQRIAVMYLGRIVESGPVDEVLNTPRHPYTIALRSAVPEARIDQPEDRIVLAGDPPSPAAPPSGCAFHPRCFHPNRDVRCERERPELRQIGGVRVACHHADGWTDKRADG